MHLSIKSKGKKDLFCSIFGQLKNFTSLINIMFYEDHIYIQGMDKSHVCLFEIKLKSSWFDSYQLDTVDMKNVAVNVSIFHKIISSVSLDELINIFYKGESDELFVEMNVLQQDGSEKNNVVYKIPLCEYDSDLLEVPETTEYDAEITFNSKKVCSIIDNMTTFGDTINVVCNDETVKFVIIGAMAEMTVNIPTEDLVEYSVNEGEEINLLYSLAYLNKLCLSNKLSENVEMCIGNECPMRIKYDLGDESTIIFYLAPKLDE